MSGPSANGPFLKIKFPCLGRLAVSKFWFYLQPPIYYL